jgi:hypothetical protein
MRSQSVNVTEEEEDDEAVVVVLLLLLGVTVRSTLESSG